MLLLLLLLLLLLRQVRRRRRRRAVMDQPNRCGTCGMDSTRGSSKAPPEVGDIVVWEALHYRNRGALIENL